MQLMHPSKDNDTSDIPTDQKYDCDKPDIFETSQFDNDSSNESMEQTDSDGESEEEEDFWTLIIRYVVEQIYAERKSNGNPGYHPSLTDPEQMLESRFM